MTASVGPLLVLLIASVTVPLAAAGQATPPADRAAIPPVVWELTALATPDQTIEITDPASYTVQFLADGELRLLADCNRGGGAYRLDGDTIEAGPLRTTKMACGRSSLDAVFVRLLEAARHWSFVDDALVLEPPADGGRLTFVPRLTNVVWDWRGFQGGDGREVVPADPAAYHIHFLPDGRYELQVDCNGGGGRYETGGSSLTLELAVLTEAICQDPELDQEFLRIVDDASSFVFRGGDLFVALPMDSGIARFAARPSDEREATPAVG